ncbi:MAG TPA: glycosyltransferase family 39 protein [Sumerlaeia bacterium]|nr:glycosyltransferase family 39 protein [Sumerlaeia bacterium]
MTWASRVPRIGRFSHWAILVLGVTLAAAALVVRLRFLNTISHDDGISYLAATGHLGLYATMMPQSRWVPASAWQAYWAPGDFGCFARIGSDLANYDIQPPLYFWLLHAWTHVFGAGLSSGPALNIVLSLLTAFFLYRASLTIGCSKPSAAVASSMWAMSSSTLAVPNEARPYALLGLISVCFFLNLARFCDRRSRFSLALVSLLSVAGLLTHYHFAVLLGLAAGLAGLSLAGQRGRRQLVALAGGIASSLGAFCALHPFFFRSIVRQQAQAPGFGLEEAAPRTVSAIQSLLDLAAPGAVSRPLSLIAVKHWGASLLLCGLVAGSIAVWLFRKRRSGDSGPKRRLGWMPAALSVSTFFCVALLYILGASPRHAMGPKYIAFISPFFFMCLGQCVDVLGRKPFNARLALAFGVMLFAYQAAYGAYTTVRYAQYQTWARSQSVRLEKSPLPLIVDTVARGVVPTILWRANPRMPVYAASQDNLLREPPSLDRNARQIVYISVLRYGNTEAKREGILGQFREAGFAVLRTNRSVFGVGEAYLLTRAGRSPDSSAKK